MASVTTTGSAPIVNKAKKLASANTKLPFLLLQLITILRFCSVYRSLHPY